MLATEKERISPAARSPVERDTDDGSHKDGPLIAKGFYKMQGVSPFILGQRFALVSVAFEK